MTTRISKIARLPKQIREQLNQRLEAGELGRTILPWLNDLPETKKVLAELFGGRRITHQNLSEWRYAGYQDWLFLQQRLQWCESLTEQETEIDKSKCKDAFETIGWHFLFEIDQALNALQSIKNPKERSARLQNLTREFARLQNAFNKSRRVSLEWFKYNDQDNDQDNSQPSPQPVPQIEDEDDDEEYYEDEDEDEDEDNIDEPETDKTENDAFIDAEEVSGPPLGAPIALRQESRRPDAPPAISSPSPLRSGGEGRGEEALRVHGEETTPTPPLNSQLPNSQPPAPPNSQPIPALAPTPNTPPTPQPVAAPQHPVYSPYPDVWQHDLPRPTPAPQPTKPKTQYYSLRSILGRRFTCVEG